MLCDLGRSYFVMSNYPFMIKGLTNCCSLNCKNLTEICRVTDSIFVILAFTRQCFIFVASKLKGKMPVLSKRACPLETGDKYDYFIHQNF